MAGDPSHRQVVVAAYGKWVLLDGTWCEAPKPTGAGMSMAKTGAGARLPHPAIRSGPNWWLDVSCLRGDIQAHDVTTTG